MEQSRFLKLKQLSEGDYQAFLYDCDGTLADNMPAHIATYIATANEYGLSIDPLMISEFAGWPIADVVTEMNIRYQTNIDPIAFRARKAELYAREYMEDILPIDFVLQHLKASAGKVHIAVVSGGDREAVEKTLEVLGIARLVEVLICAGDTLKGKPFPDPFLKAAALLNVEPSKCLVFEDGMPGVTAAKSAGMAWLRIDQIV